MRLRGRRINEQDDKIEKSLPISTISSDQASHHDGGSTNKHYIAEWCFLSRTNDYY